jgi:hypothetical protein
VYVVHEMYVILCTVLYSTRDIGHTVGHRGPNLRKWIQVQYKYSSTCTGITNYKYLYLYCTVLYKYEASTVLVQVPCTVQYEHSLAREYTVSHNQGPIGVCHKQPAIGGFYNIFGIVTILSLSNSSHNKQMNNNNNKTTTFKHICLQQSTEPVS